VNRGEVWTIGDRTDLRYRVVVLSGDTHNDRPNAAPYCAPVVRQRGSTIDLPPFAVPLSETDPVSGVVVVNRMRRLPVSSGAERLGMITGASLSRVDDALRNLFEL
jgi:mRNA interferase MazF